ncbi:MAG: DUF3344 domain-containing protein, partial [Spirochaetales bacterium]|nr:DUF3344 domain-containing protein [Spirochaetales bacterium]
TPKEFGAGVKREMELPEVEGEHKFKTENEVYNLTVWVDPEDEILEKYEGNNKMEMMMGPDIVIAQLKASPGYPVVGVHNCTINVTLKNEGCLPAKDFNVILYLNHTYLTETDEIAKLNYTISYPEPVSLYPNADRLLTFYWHPEKHGQIYYDVDIKVVADPNNTVPELDERNNEKSKGTPWRIYLQTGYDGDHPLRTYAHNLIPIRGGVNYTYGDSYYLGGDANPHYGPVHFENVIPKGASVELARLYLYWVWSYIKVDDPLRPGQKKQSPAPLDVEVEFNGHVFDTVPADGNYTDLPHATGFDVGWGTYCYDVTADVENNNTVNAIRKGPWEDSKYTAAIAGMGLLIIYKDEDLPLTTYWINEGADVLWVSAMTGLTPEDCTTDALFEGAADLDRVNATLWTIVPFGNCVDPDENRLYFNEKRWQGVWNSYPSVPGRRSPEVAIDKNRYVTKYLKPANNIAKLQDNNDCMMPANAFLILTYPPDLVRPALPSKVYVGNTIPVAIYNQGRSDARDFYVSFYVGGEFKGKEHVDEIVGGESRELTFPWTAPITKVGHLVELGVWVDSEDDVTELREDNNNASRPVEVSLGGLEHNSDGRGGSKGPGFGEGDSDIESVEAGAPIASKAAIGKSGGEKITGYLMKGTLSQSEAAGGGSEGERAEFSWVGLLLRIAMLAVAAVLVYAGYLLERRRQNNINNEK